MRRRRAGEALFLALAALAVLAWPSPAHSRPDCVDRKTVVEHLKRQYAEKVSADGFTTGGGIMEVLVGPFGRTWTIIVTMPSGKTCMIAAGRNWFNVPQGDQS